MARHAGSVARVAERLRGDLKEHPVERLPPVRSLGRTYGVSMVTALKAVHLLESQGIVAVKHGAGTFPVDPLSPPVRRSATACADALRSAVAGGRLRPGEPLPKQQNLCMTYGVSSATLCEALGILRAEEVVHKSGKRWIAGPRQRFRPHRTAGLRPTVLVVLPERVSWRFFCTNQLVSSFTHELISELNSRDIRHEIAFEQESESGAARLCGHAAVADYARRLGEDFLGSVLCGEVTQFADLDGWISLLQSFRRPVAWFDFSDQGAGYDRRRYPFPWYFHVRPDEPAAVAIALDALHESGHRTVGVPACGRYRPYAWQGRRIDLIRSVASRLSPPLEIAGCDQNEDWWTDPEREPTDDSMATFLSKLEHESVAPAARHDEGVPRLVRLRDRLARKIPSLAALAHDRRVTGIVALNDWLGVSYHHFFEKTGLRIPRDLSIVAFDNQISYHHYPVSSIDFGYRELGYRTAHLIIGDLPVQCDAWGAITGQPRLFDRGSIAPPPRRQDS